MIQEEDGGFYTSSEFDQLLARLSIAHASDTLASLAYRQVVSVFELQANLLTILYKLQWLSAQRDHGLDDVTWMYFAASDVVAFHVVLRSLFDEVAEVAGCLAIQYGVVPQSFHKLQQWISKPGNRNRLGEPVAGVIASCDWFDAVRELRDDLVHRAATAIVFPHVDRILFQIHLGANRRVLIKPVMFNEHVADFTLYAAHVMVRLVAFLEQFAIAIMATDPVLADMTPMSIKRGHPGLGVLRAWSAALELAIQAAG